MTGREGKMEELYRTRLARYTTTLRNGKADTIPIRPFAAEFTARHCGMTCQEVTHDFGKAFDAVARCAADYDWDAVVANMVYVWTGLTEAIGLKYYGVPGIGVPPDTGFQYLEPAEEAAFMKADEYDALIADPTGFLYNVWLPRVAGDVRAPGEPSTYRNNLSFVKGGMAMMEYFSAFGPQVERLRRESGTVSAIAGILKAPFDIIADKLRGYLGLTMDMYERPEKVLAACEALMPHLLHVAQVTADPEKQVPVGFWMHRGCVPFISHAWFDSHYWPTLKPIIEELWRGGHQTLFYAEGDWTHHLDRFAELPDASIVYHCDRSDPKVVHEAIGHKFCLSGGVPNTTLSFGTPDEVRAACKEVIDIAGKDGGYIMDASAIMQNDTDPENLRVLTEFTREYGSYADGSLREASAERSEGIGIGCAGGRPGDPDGRKRPGVCIPWDEKRSELKAISGDEELLRRVWEDVDALGNMYVWQCLLSF